MFKFNRLKAFVRSSITHRTLELVHNELSPLLETPEQLTGKSYQNKTQIGVSSELNNFCQHRQNQILKKFQEKFITGR